MIFKLTLYLKFRKSITKIESFLLVIIWNNNFIIYTIGSNGYFGNGGFDGNSGLGSFGSGNGAYTGNSGYSGHAEHGGHGGHGGYYESGGHKVPIYQQGGILPTGSNSGVSATSGAHSQATGRF